MKYTKADTDRANERLHDLLKPGDTVYTSLQHVSRSGMARDLNVYVIKDNEPVWITGYVATLLELPRHGDALRVTGAGMDMGFHVAYSLSSKLFPKGFDCIADPSDDRPYASCPSNDHSNHPRDKFTHHTSGGYALNHRWLS